MRRNQSFGIIFGMLFLSCFALTSAARAGYQFTTLDSPRGNPTQIYGLNNAGVVSGLDEDINFDAAGLLFTGGVGKATIAPGSIDTEFYQVNNSGHAAVSYFGSDGIYHAAVYNSAPNTFTNLPDITGAAENLAGGINNQGLVVGDTFTDNSFDGGQGWIWNGSAYTFFTAPGSDAAHGGTATYSVNDAAQIVGYYFDGTGTKHGFLKTGSTFTTLDEAGASETTAYGINNLGVVVGEYVTGSTEHGFLWNGGTFTTLDYPGATGTWITAINDAGNLAGFYLDAGGTLHGFSAVPEPASILVLACAAMLTLRRRATKMNAQ